MIEHALENGLMVAQALKDKGLIWGAILSCQQQVHYVQDTSDAIPIHMMSMTPPSTIALPVI